MWDELGISPCDDPKAIRRAYAVRLKKLDPDSDPAGFTRLREALEQALAAAARAEHSSEPPDNWSVVALDFAEQPDIDVPLPARSTSRSGELPAPELADDRAVEWSEASTADATLLDELNSALGRRDATTALGLYYRACATGAVALYATAPLLDRLFAQVVEEPAIDSAAFRELVRISGWDRPADRSEAANDVHRLVLARLGAEDWYDSLVALAARRGKTPRKKAKLARLVLGRIGKYWMPRVDRNALKSMLDQFRTHERWLSRRIAPAWASKLERRWRRRQIFWGMFFALFLAGMLLNWFRVYVIELTNAGLSTAMALATLPLLVIVLWLLKGLVGWIRKRITVPGRGVFWATIFALLLAGMLLNWLRDFISEHSEESLSAVAMLATIPLAAILAWVLKLIVGEIRKAIRFRPGRSGLEPPDDPRTHGHLIPDETR